MTQTHMFSSVTDTDNARGCNNDRSIIKAGGNQKERKHRRERKRGESSQNWNRHRDSESSSRIKTRIRSNEINFPAKTRCVSKVGIIRVAALKFFVARGSPADNYVSYLHISRDRRRYRYFSVLIHAVRAARAKRCKSVGICIRG